MDTEARFGLEKDYLQGRVIAANTQLMGIASLAAQEGLGAFQIDEQTVHGIEQIREGTPFEAFMRHNIIGTVLVPARLRFGVLRKFPEIKYDNAWSSISNKQKQGILVSRDFLKLGSGSDLEMGSVKSFLAASESFDWFESPRLFSQLDNLVREIDNRHLSLKGL